ncbi:amino acid permease, partial [Serratia fonticola]
IRRSCALRLMVRDPQKMLLRFLTMNVGLIISVLAGWLAWTMLCAEIPMVAGQKGAFPRAFARTNSKQAANVSLWVSSFVMQAAMLLVYFSNDAWNTMYNISALMVVPAYITTTLYMAKICLNREYDQYAKKGRKFALVSGIWRGPKKHQTVDVS